MLKQRIMVFGTFDGLHKGHLDFFKQARAKSKNPFLVVSIARDINVEKIKGKPPHKNEFERLVLVRRNKLVDKAVLSGKSNYLSHIIKERPDIIALGYDQKHYTRGLKKDLQDRGLTPKIVRLKPYKEYIYKNSLLKNKVNKLN
ncbi:MAG: synthetase [Patescibacteria group bacterium]|nr:synthetase [Patescibacteria group bacterium]